MNPRTLMAGALAAIVLIAIVAALAGGLFSPGNTENSEERVIITGSGSSFIAPQMYAWASQVKEKYPWLIVEYESVGSGAGLSNFLQGIRDFGASDPPLPRNVWEQHQGRIVQMPVILGAVVVVYNIPGMTEPLNLTGEVLALIYKGEIQYWDDPTIARLNPSIKLPHEEIVAAHRSDSSGTTQVFTTFLRKSAPDVWPEDLVGKAIDWPVDSTGRGVGAKGNEGVTQTVKSTPYSIGYVEWSYAIDSNLPMAALQNAVGEFVLPSVETIQRAAESLTLPNSPLGDFSSIIDSLVYPDAPGAYPVASFTFLFFWTEYPQEKVDAVKKFIEYINTEGQSGGNIVTGYVPIPDEIRQFNLKALDYIKAKG